MVVWSHEQRCRGRCCGKAQRSSGVRGAGRGLLEQKLRLSTLGVVVVLGQGGGTACLTGIPLIGDVNWRDWFSKVSARILLLSLLMVFL